jgi:hypothetical protein
MHIRGDLERREFDLVLLQDILNFRDIPESVVWAQCEKPLTGFKVMFVGLLWKLCESK